MFSFEEYVVAWLAYLVCVLGVLSVFWRITRALPWLYCKQSLRLIVASMLLVPAQVEESPLFWAPAWVKAMLVFVFSGTDELMSVGKLVLTGTLFALIVYFTLSIIMLFFRKRPQKKKTTQAA